MGDTNYESAAMLGWLVDEKQIEPHMPVFDKSERTDGTFSRSDFQWDEQANETAVLKDTPYVAIGDLLRIRVSGSRKPIRSSTVQARQTVPHAPRRIAAVNG